MTLPDLLPVAPFPRPVRGAVTLPGSKSLTNRALLLAALCDEPVTLTGALFSEDTHLMAEALRQLGCRVEADPAAGRLGVTEQSRGFARTTPVELFVGLAGTAARFLTALCAAAPQGIYRIDGVPQMQRRPMRGLIEALRALGADVRCTGAEGFFPLEIHAHGLRGGAASIDASESSQLLSALLMVAPLAREPLDLTLAAGVRWPFVDMTAQLMRQFGGPAVERRSEDRLQVAAPARYEAPNGGRYAIEPDATAASYFLALPLVAGGALELTGFQGPGAGLQGDTRFVGVLARAGLTTERNAGGLRARFEPPAVRRGVEQNFAEFSDTFLTLAAIAPLLAGPTRITGIAHTRKQETDRVSGMARELTRLGQRVIETEDGLEIHPQPLRVGQTIETYGDHRFAMSFGILGAHDLLGTGEPWLTLRNPACSAKTFPDFFALRERLRQESLSL